LIAAILASTVLPTTVYAAKNTTVHVVVDNELVLFPDAQPFVDNKGIVLVPVMNICEKLGATASWNASTNSVTIINSKDTITINIPVNKAKNKKAFVTLNGQAVPTDIAPFLKNSCTYVSLKFLADLLHCKTTWNSGIKTVFVTSSGYVGDQAASGEKTKTSSEILHIKSFDGYTLTGKLDLPEGASNVSTLVIFVPGTGPNTYDNKRQIGKTEFNYYDLFAQELAKRQVGFFRYNTRGVEEGSEPPTYDTINQEEYKKYTPENQAQDIEAMVTELKKDEKLKNAKIVLLGWSEGTIIAPLVAERNNVEISSLMLAGYCNVKMQDIIEWQLSGEASMIFYCQYFDTNLDGIVTKKEFEADPYGVVKSVLGVKFTDVDINKDNKLTSADFYSILAKSRENVLNAIAQNDGDWIWNNYFHVTTEWLSGHAKLDANKDRLLKLNIPVNIFHGVSDQNVPVQGVFNIFDSYRVNGKTNLKAFVYVANNHDLNYILYPMNGTITAGLRQIFDECAKVK
jgi:Dipeptidyl aminopeptidases/acylaminoacyl-peptidases